MTPTQIDIGLPAGNGFVAALLILRAFMHHRGLVSVRFTRDRTLGS